MVTLQEIELLALLLQRVGATPIEVAWANDVLNRLRAMTAAELQKQAQPEEEKDAS